MTPASLGYGLLAVVGVFLALAALAKDAPDDVQIVPADDDTDAFPEIPWWGLLLIAGLVLVAIWVTP